MSHETLPSLQACHIANLCGGPGTSEKFQGSGLIPSQQHTKVVFKQQRTAGSSDMLNVSRLSLGAEGVSGGRGPLEWGEW